MIESAEEFVRLRTSDNPNEYHRAAWEEANDAVWLDVIKRFPEMIEWVAHNKTISEEIIRILAIGSSRRVLEILARKARTPTDLLFKLAQHEDETIRMSVARNKKVPKEILESLLGDEWEEIPKFVRQKLEKMKL